MTNVDLCRKLKININAKKVIKLYTKIIIFKLYKIIFQKLCMVDLQLKQD